MPESTRQWTALRWKLDVNLRVWMLDLAERLHLNPSVVMRMFLLQLREGEPTTRERLFTFVEMGLRDPVLEPAALSIIVERDLQLWLSEFVRGLQHPSFPQAKVYSHHLLTGYARYLHANEKSCVRFGAIRLEGIQEA